MGYFEPDGERMRKVLCLRDDVRNVRYIEDPLSQAYAKSDTNTVEK
jgi:hypothetical protein